jgi:anti-sigma regulatory factor (Ser/Thr protein kinase)
MGSDDLLRISLKNQLGEIQRFQDEFAQFAAEKDIDTSTVRDLHVVFDELLSNIVRYAYLDDEAHQIEVEIDASTGRLKITIVDDGIPFNPLEVDTPDTSLPLEERQIGGLGIHLVINIVDELTYERDGDRNIVVLKKSLE